MKGDFAMDQQSMQGQNQQQAQLGTQTVGLMTNPPEIVTDKDHSYLKDALSWELLAVKKCHAFAGMCQDAEVANLVTRIGKMHQQHYTRLLSEINPSKTLY
mgnify:FL=1|jgi:hypothetical protein